MREKNRHYIASDLLYAPWNTWNEKQLNVSDMRDRSNDPSHHELGLVDSASMEMFCATGPLSERDFRSWCDGSSNRSLVVNPLSYFSFQPVLHDWYTKDCGMCYPVCGIENIKEPFLLLGKSNPCSRGSVFPLSLSEWSFTICLKPCNRK